MTLKWFGYSCLVSLVTMAYANELPVSSHQLGIQAAISTGGNLGIGLVNYWENKEAGLLLSAKWSNDHTGFVVPAAFLGIRHPLFQQTDFAYGLDLATKLGQEDGHHIDANIQVGPYISLEQALTSNLLLVGWIEPYSFEYEKINDSSNTTQRLFGAGGIGLSYLLC